MSNNIEIVKIAITDRKMKPIVICLLCPLLILSFACKDQDNPGPIGLPYSNWNAGNVSFKIYQGNTPGQEGDPTTKVVIVTDSTYPCINFVIDASMSFEQRKIIITLQGVRMPGDICLTALGPASYLQELSLASGTYSFIIRAGTSSDSYGLIVTDSSLVTLPGDATISRPSLTTAWKIPEKSFAFVGGTTVETSWMFDDFIDSLKTVASIREFNFPDTGYVAYPRNSSGHYVDNPARYYLYAAESDFDTAGAVLARFSRGVIGSQQGIGFYLVNWRGKQYMSWVVN